MKAIKWQDEHQADWSCVQLAAEGGIKEDELKHARDFSATSQWGHAASKGCY